MWKVLRGELDSRIKCQMSNLIYLSVKGNMPSVPDVLRVKYQISSLKCQVSSVKKKSSVNVNSINCHQVSKLFPGASCQALCQMPLPVFPCSYPNCHTVTFGTSRSPFPSSSPASQNTCASETGCGGRVLSRSKAVMMMMRYERWRWDKTNDNDEVK